MASRYPLGRGSTPDIRPATTGYQPTMRLIIALLGVVAAALAVGFVVVLRSSDAEPLASPESVMPGRLLVGLQDDPSFRWDADRAAMLDRAHDTGVSLLRTIVVWKDTAPTRPADAADPFDPA